MNQTYDHEALNNYIRNTWAPQCGALLLEQIERSGMRRDTVAALSGIGISVLNRIITGEIIPRDNRRIAIAHTLRCRVDQIWPAPELEDLLDLPR